MQKKHKYRETNPEFQANNQNETTQKIGNKHIICTLINSHMNNLNFQICHSPTVIVEVTFVSFSLVEFSEFPTYIVWWKNVSGIVLFKT